MGVENTNAVQGTAQIGGTDDTQDTAPTGDTDRMATVQGTTAQKMLSEVDAAICKVMRGGQSYQIGSRSLTRADLGLLYKMKTELTAQIAAESESHLMENTYVAVFEGR